jgi:uncharacterized protein
MELSAADVERQTQEWIHAVVIGLNFCPFAHGPVAKGRLRLVVSEANGDVDVLAQCLADELAFLSKASEDAVETTLIVAPRTLEHFADFNDFLGVADAIVRGLGYEGVFQIASFHPNYQFEGTRSTDVSNFTNRSPFPTLHILRESSVSRALVSMPDTQKIIDDNLARLDAMPAQQLAALFPYVRMSH